MCEELRSLISENENILDMKLSNKLIERLILDLQVKIMNNETFVNIIVLSKK